MSPETVLALLSHDTDHCLEGVHGIIPPIVEEAVLDLEVGQDELEARLLCAHAQVLVKVLRVNNFEEHVVGDMEPDVFDQGYVAFDIVADQNYGPLLAVGQSWLKNACDDLENVSQGDKLGLPKSWREPLSDIMQQPSSEVEMYKPKIKVVLAPVHMSAVDHAHMFSDPQMAAADLRDPILAIGTRRQAGKISGVKDTEANLCYRSVVKLV